NAKYGDGIRGILKHEKAVRSLVHFGHQQVFDGATTYTCLLLLEKGTQRRAFDFLRVDDLEAWREGANEPSARIQYAHVGQGEWNFISGAERELHQRLMGAELRLRDVTDRIFQGLKTSADKIYIVDRLKE